MNRLLTLASVTTVTGVMAAVALLGGGSATATDKIPSGSAQVGELRSADARAGAGDPDRTFHLRRQGNAPAPVASYPVNRRGWTYGSGLDAEKTGDMPDLVATVLPDGREGFVRVGDIFFSPDVAPPTVVTLYDREGEKIGESRRAAPKSSPAGKPSRE